MMWTSITDFFIFCVSKHNILADRHTDINIWLSELPKFIEGTILLGYHNMQCHILKLICILLGLLDHEDEGKTVFDNTRHSSINGTMSNPKRFVNSPALL